MAEVPEVRWRLGQAAGDGEQAEFAVAGGAPRGPSQCWLVVGGLRWISKGQDVHGL